MFVVVFPNAFKLKLNVITLVPSLTQSRTIHHMMHFITITLIIDHVIAV